MSLEFIISVILILPMVASLLIFSLRAHPKFGAYLSICVSMGLFLITIHAYRLWDGVPKEYIYKWIEAGSFIIEFGYLINAQTFLLLLVVTTIGFLVQLFSLGYMHADASQSRYFAGLCLFMFSMLGIVIANNLILMFIFWELVGVSSYILIAQYADTLEAVKASKKAFIVNRIADVGFLLGILWVYTAYGSGNLSVLQAQVSAQTLLLKSALGYLLICGFVGKSAQFPLQIWLPDAMAGPTPVSALIHAATMVAAGIYLLVRIGFLLTPNVLYFIVWNGAGMSLLAGLCAIAQTDIKKVLAYSTLSQLGYMAVAIGLGSPGIALFHMTTHACFKAGLFLGAGSIIYALHHEQSLYKMGGLWKKLPLTTISFLISTLALCAVYGTAGFFSKDAILEMALIVNKPLFCILCCSSLLTVIYMTRLCILCFLGHARTSQLVFLNAPTLSMQLPVVCLTALSIASGYLNLWPMHLKSLFEPTLELIHIYIQRSLLADRMVYLNLCTVAGGMAIAWSLYHKSIQKDVSQHDTVDPLSHKWSSVLGYFRGGLGFNYIYDGYVKNIQDRLSHIFQLLDIIGISGIFFRGIAGILGLCSLGLKKLHNQTPQAYAYWILAGLLLYGIYGMFLFLNIFNA